MPSLLVLAAGMGSRYGGLKQIDPVGPSGETLLDYAVFDARRSGFGRVVFVIRRDFVDAFGAQVISRYAGRVDTEVVFQSPDALPPGFAAPPGRTKPWGTGHAVWCARGAIRDNFAVINADDFYGEDAFRKLGSFLGEDGPSRSSRAAFALVGFRLSDTLSENGAVARGICTVAKGRLLSIVERTRIAREDVGAGRRYSGDEVVSMNCWGFAPSVFALLGERLGHFLADRLLDPGAEFYLPSAVSDMIDAARAEVEVLPAAGPWFGVTYPGDRARVQASLAGLVRAGRYPARLF
jgi:NDP-sugar pyrophosphorylase family protein